MVSGYADPHYTWCIGSEREYTRLTLLLSVSRDGPVDTSTAEAPRNSPKTYPKIASNVPTLKQESDRHGSAFKWPLQLDLIKTTQYDSLEHWGLKDYLLSYSVDFNNFLEKIHQL